MLISKETLQAVFQIIPAILQKHYNKYYKYYCKLLCNMDLQEYTEYYKI